MNLSGEQLKTALPKSRVAIVGLGQSGVSAAKMLLNLRAQLFLSDSDSAKVNWARLPPELKGVPAEFGKHTERLLEQDLLVVSPGVPWQQPILFSARKKNIPVWTELELAYRIGSFAKLIGITGTNGKTTTVSLLGDMCRESGLKTLVAGNIGRPLSDYALDAGEYDCVALEISSYMLEGISAFRVETGAVLNLTPDHLRRHGTMGAYCAAKAKLFLNSRTLPRGSDVALLNYEDPRCRKIAKSVKCKVVWFSARRKLPSGIFWDKKTRSIIARLNSPFRYLTFPAPRYLPGRHNIENSCAAIGCALQMGLPFAAVRRSLQQFKGVEHRLEQVRELDRTVYVNDSKSTNVDSTLKALEAYDCPLWLILGGQDKGSSYKSLIPMIKKT